MSFKAWERTQATKQLEALRQWSESHNFQNARIHVSSNPKVDLHNTGQWIAPNLRRINGKPSGLWYALGSTWINFILQEHPSGLGEYIFEIKINPSKMIFIQNQSQLEEFESYYSGNLDKSGAWGRLDQIAHRYGIPKDYPKTHMLHQLSTGEKKYRPLMPDWQFIAREFWGIELNPYEVDSFWTQEWAVPSGCIWNHRGVKSIDLISHYDPKQGIYVS